MNVDTIRNGIATRLQTITGLRVHARVPDAIEPPAAFLSLSNVSYDDTFDGCSTVNFDLVLAVAGWDAPRAQEAIDPYVNNTGSKSIYAAVHGAAVNGAESVRVTGASDMDRNFTIAGSDYVGIRFSLEALAAP